MARCSATSSISTWRWPWLARRSFALMAGSPPARFFLFASTDSRKGGCLRAHRLLAREQHDHGCHQGLWLFAGSYFRATSTRCGLCTLTFPSTCLFPTTPRALTSVTSWARRFISNCHPHRADASLCSDARGCDHQDVQGCQG